METHYIYLAGNHKDNGDWRIEFNSYNRKLNQNSSMTLIGIDPFHRQIEENDHLTIVSRDIAILSDVRLSYVVLMSDQGNGMFSTGTSCEMILARSLGKPIVVITSCTDNWIHPFTLHFASHIVSSISEATQLIRTDLSEGKTYGNLTDDLASLSNYKFNAPDIDPFWVSK